MLSEFVCGIRRHKEEHLICDVVRTLSQICARSQNSGNSPSLPFVRPLVMRALRVTGELQDFRPDEQSSKASRSSCRYLCPFARFARSDRKGSFDEQPGQGEQRQRQRMVWSGGAAASGFVLTGWRTLGRDEVVFNVRIADYHIYFVGCDESGRLRAYPKHAAPESTLLRRVPSADDPSIRTLESLLTQFQTSQNVLHAHIESWLRRATGSIFSDFLSSSIAVARTSRWRVMNLNSRMPWVHSRRTCRSVPSSSWSARHDS